MESSPTLAMLKYGFSLLEMMIVLLIFGIILSFTYPNYQSYMTRAHRLEGQIALLDLAQRLEQYYALYQTYTDASIGTQSGHDVLTKALTNQGLYLLQIREANDSHFSIQAIPQGTHGNQDTLCQTLQFNELGEQQIAAGPIGNPSGNWEMCWS